MLWHSNAPTLHLSMFQLSLVAAHSYLLSSLRNDDWRDFFPHCSHFLVFVQPWWALLSVQKKVLSSSQDTPWSWNLSIIIFPPKKGTVAGNRSHRLFSNYKACKTHLKTNLSFDSCTSSLIMPQPIILPFPKNNKVILTRSVSENAINPSEFLLSWNRAGVSQWGHGPTAVWWNVFRTE